MRLLLLLLQGIGDDVFVLFYMHGAGGVTHALHLQGGARRTQAGRQAGKQAGKQANAFLNRISYRQAPSIGNKLRLRGTWFIE